MPVTAASDQETADVDTATWTIPALRARSAHLRHLELASQDSYEIGKRDRAIREAYDGWAKVPRARPVPQPEAGPPSTGSSALPPDVATTRRRGSWVRLQGPRPAALCGVSSAAQAGGPEPRCVDRTHRAGAWFRSTTL